MLYSTVPICTAHFSSLSCLYPSVLPLSMVSLYMSVFGDGTLCAVWPSREGRVLEKEGQSFGAGLDMLISLVGEDTVCF